MYMVGSLKSEISNMFNNARFSVNQVKRGTGKIEA